MSSRAATLSAWERWEMASIAAPANEDVVAPAEPPAPPVLVPIEPVRLFDEAELGRLHEQARLAGAAEGRAQGLAQGRIEGRQAGLVEMQAEAERLLALAQSLPVALRGAERALADSVLALAFELGRQLAGAALKADPDCVLAVVRDLLASEPAAAGTPRLLLHPEDAALVREHLGPELQEAGWSVQPDPALTRGGCLVRSGNGELDATVETRAQRVEAALACRLRAPAPDHA
jgi:flagellar assembly protein FliH